MAVSVAGGPRVLRALPGRIRFNLPDWNGEGKQRIEATLRRIDGISAAQANAVTRNVLVQFDPAVIDEAGAEAAMRSLPIDQINAAGPDAPHPPVRSSRHGGRVRARIAVCGLDRDPALAQGVVELLQSHPGVTASVNHLTGRVLVEFAEHEAELDDLLAEVAGFELPDLPGEDRPVFPLDPAPLIQSGVRAVAAGLGLGLLALSRLLGNQEPLPGAGAAVQVASIIGILQGIPPVRYGLRRLLGRTAADLLINAPATAALTLAGSPLGLTLAEAESLRLFTEVRGRQDAWRRNHARMADAPSDQPNALIHVGNGERSPLVAHVVEGTGTAIGRDGMPRPVEPGGIVPAGARLYGGPFALKLSDPGYHAFRPQPRPAPPAPTIFDRYTRFVAPLALAYAVGTALFTRSWTRTLSALLLVSPRTAAIGIDIADLGASARVLRAGVVVVGTRPHRVIRLPGLVLLDGTRLLTDRLEIGAAHSLAGDCEREEVLAHAAAVATAAGSPWGGAFRAAGGVTATQGSFDGKMASAVINGARYSLGPAADYDELPVAARWSGRGDYLLVLRNEQESVPVGVFALRPRLASGIGELLAACRRYKVELAVLAEPGNLAAQALARRAGVRVVEDDAAVGLIRAYQAGGGLVAYVADSPSAAHAFAACDLAIGITDRRSRFSARVDLLARDLEGVAAIIEAGARRNATVQDSVGLSALSNVVGAVWGLRGAPGLEAASRGVYVTALGATADGWLRLGGGERRGLELTALVDPRPERWGRRDPESVLRLLNASPDGLGSAQAAQRRQATPGQVHRSRLLAALVEQAKSPLIGLMAAGAALSLFTGAVGDVLIISATILINMAVAVWQEHKANQLSDTLNQIRAVRVRVLRDGRPVVVPPTEVVSGDILLLASGDRVAADARLLQADGLEVDEAALTGESLLVAKAPDSGTDAGRVVLEGSDVISGTGRAVVVAVGRQTRLGATVAALAGEDEAESEQSPLGTRLAQILRTFLPLTLGGGATVVASGFAWGRPLQAQLATGVTVALAGVPEGLPLLARVGEAGVAGRLVKQQAVVRRLSAVEAMGRVDVACVDKTGTLTEGKLAVTRVAGLQGEARLPAPGADGKGTPSDLPDALQHVLLTAALASPHPDAPGAKAHPTDAAVVRAAVDAGLDGALRVQHEAELPFDASRSFHATVAQGRLCLKGAPEALIDRCSGFRLDGEVRAMDEAAQQRWLDRSHDLAGQGLRVLMVAEGEAGQPLERPQQLTALGFIGISDPLRPQVQAALGRCRAAGVRVIMITGDHPATAQAIARDAGLLAQGGEVITAYELTELHNGDLDQRVERAVVVARATPLDKLRIIESLQRQGHVVAMTGDGVNDAPALRLANVGVAMGGGTEVARQTADVIITDDNFSALVEALVEGRSFWRNMRRALGLLLGGNLGELGLIAGGTLFGFQTPLTAAQILATNAITDILPALAVTLQRPEHRNLAGLQREGTGALQQPLRREVLRRGLATAAPALAAYALMNARGTLPQARSVAFASIVTTQLAQTLDAGRAEGGLTGSVLGAVGGSTAVLLAMFAIPPLRSFFQLVFPGPLGVLLIGAGSLAAVLLARSLAAESLRLPSFAGRPLPAGA